MLFCDFSWKVGRHGAQQRSTVKVLSLGVRARVEEPADRGCLSELSGHMQ
jgi:hypothetical protein